MEPNEPWWCKITLDFEEMAFQNRTLGASELDLLRCTALEFQHCFKVAVKEMVTRELLPPDLYNHVKLQLIP